MKILLDPIITNDPQFCVMNYKMKQIVEHLLNVRDDVFFYWFIPDDIEGLEGQWDVDPAWFPQTDRLKLFTLPTYRDRMREYRRIHPVMERLTAYKGGLWDIDAVITSRHQQVPALVQNMHKINSAVKQAGLKPVFIVDDMPILSFKGFVAQTCPEFEDLVTLTGYLASTKSFFVNFWERDQMMALARNWVSPSVLRRLSEKAVGASPMHLQQDAFRLKTPEILQSIAKREQAFTVAYTQRYEKSHRRSEDILELMMKQWIYRGGSYPMRFVITSNVRGINTSAVLQKTDFVELYRAPREEFWRMVREEMCVVLVMAPEDGYSYSCLEPLILGTPVVIQRAPYSEAMLGPDYPFFVDGFMEAYGMVKMFFDNYIEQYKKFAEWQQTKFRDMMMGRNKNYVPHLIEQELLAYDQRLGDYAERRRSGRSDWNSLTKTLLDGAPSELVMQDWFEALQKEGKIRSNLNFAGGALSKRVTFEYTEPHHLKLEMVCNGYVDASTKVGHLRRRS